jgi:carbon-monoxide dehydrogenase iron sulfur subunit
MIVKSVIVRPELCVGCMQCMIRCAEAHSQSKVLAAAISEAVLAKPRIHIGVGPELKPFPNKCRHCEPAPCQEACMPGAIRGDILEGHKIVDPTRCIHCGMCSMACPYYVIRYYPDHAAPGGRSMAVKCDACFERQAQGQVPACVEACKTEALTFGDVNVSMKQGTNRLAMAVWGVNA